MKTIVFTIAKFFDDIFSNSKNIDIDYSSHTKIDRYISGNVDFNKQEIQRVTGKIKNRLGVDIPESEEYLFCLQGESIRWNRPEQKSNEGLLSGGCYFNGVIDIFLYPIAFWDKSVREFSKIECEHLAHIPENLRWFESSTAHNDPEYTPHYGCVLLDPPSFPDRFFFYDSGLLFSLPFSSHEEYFAAMMSCAAVECWQYFYIEPEEIINKSTGLSYITWSLHTRTNIDEQMRRLVFNDAIEHDRLDLIDEYLERCVRLLPDSFPFIDFSQHLEHYKTFKMHYEKQK